MSVREAERTHEDQRRDDDVLRGGGAADRADAADVFALEDADRVADHAPASSAWWGYPRWT